MLKSDPICSICGAQPIVLLFGDLREVGPEDGCACFEPLGEPRGFCAQHRDHPDACPRTLPRVPSP
jgi:hypothetical protein